jgi:hypothetical protein
MNRWVHTPSEVFFARRFAEKIVNNIDDKDFMDGRNQKMEETKKGRLKKFLLTILKGSWQRYTFSIL